MSYVELHCHSAFSFLDGASLPDELVAAALERGHTALALTDHDTVSGSMEFAQAAASLGLRAIHGAEVRVRDAGGHFLYDGAVPHGEGASSGGIFFEDPDGTRLEIFTSDGLQHAHAPMSGAPSCGFF